MKKLLRGLPVMKLFFTAGALLLVLNLAGCAAFFEDYAYQPLGASQAADSY